MITVSPEKFYLGLSGDKGGKYSNTAARVIFRRSFFYKAAPDIGL